jgi:galactokinase
MSVDWQQARNRFERHYGHVPEVGVRAPGRVNIIGEHTDYNAGFVLPMAIERETVILARARNDRRLRARALNLERSAEADLIDIHRHPDEPWLDYVIGVARELQKLGQPTLGADILIAGDVPIGAGLSSSASLEMAALVMFEVLGGYRVEDAEAARLGQRVENEFLGLKTGIMDQFVVRTAQAGHAVFLDCRTLVPELVPVAFENALFVIADTGVARGLAASKYNERVAECMEAVRILNRETGRSATHLRDFSQDDVETHRAALPEVVYRRARHIVTENERTRAACTALRAGDAPGLGELMNASDQSLRLDYEVTCPELDTMTELARAIPGCYGARMTGAGFGGCTVHLVAADRAEAFAERLMADYRARTGLEGQVIVSAPAQGASRLFG